MTYLLFHLIEDILRPLSGSLGRYLRRIYYERRISRCGKNLVIDPGVHIYSPKDITLGDNVWIDHNCVLIAGKANNDRNNTKNIVADLKTAKRGKLSIGSHCHIGIGSIIQAHAGVQIGDYFTSSAGCKIYTLSNNPMKCKHGTVSNPNGQVYYIESPSLIGKNVWLGLNVSVIGGYIGDDVFVKANSIVSGKINSNQIVSNSDSIKVRF